MVFEGQFNFAGTPRWNLGWPTPNYAGAWLATLLPVTWLWPRSWLRRGGSSAGLVVLFVLVESALWWALCRTYSRGALVAALAALFLCAVREGMGHPEGRRSVLGIGAVRLAGVFLLLLLSGFWGRIEPAHLMEDRSVLNRLELWQGGAAMVAAAPWNGWGSGESGRAYMHWFQPMDRTEGYATMVNSYLHVAVEQGVFVLAAVLAIALGVIALGVLIPAGPGEFRARLAWVSGAVLLAWAVANVFSSLWIDWRLWLVPLLATAGVLQAAGRLQGPCRWRAVLAVCSIGLAVPALLIGWGRQEANGIPRPAADGSVSLGALGDAEVLWQVWPDAEVLGRYYGKEMRRWAEAVEGTALLVHDPSGRQSWEISGQPIDGVFFGRASAWVAQYPEARFRRLVFVHPQGLPPERAMDADAGAEWVVILPEVDEPGNRRAWETWARSAGARLVISEGVGTDVRDDWPGVWLRAVEGSSRRGESI